MKPIKSLADELSDLVEIAENEGHFCWEAFEKQDDGHLVFNSLYKCYPYDFYMRVGLHMKQPRQAIMCCGKFIKVRKFETKPHWQLKELNPHKIQDSLYFVAGTGGYGQAQNQWLYPQQVVLGGTQVHYDPPSYHWSPEKAFPEPSFGGPFYSGYLQQAPTITTGTVTMPLNTSGSIQWVSPTTYQGTGQAVNSGNWTGLNQPATGIQAPGLLGTIGSMFGLTSKI